MREWVVSVNFLLLWYVSLLVLLLLHQVNVIEKVEVARGSEIVFQIRYSNINAVKELIVH
jgi:hypothetical protein